MFQYRGQGLNTFRIMWAAMAGSAVLTLAKPVSPVLGHVLLGLAAAGANFALCRKIGPNKRFETHAEHEFSGFPIEYFTPVFLLACWGGALYHFLKMARAVQPDVIPPLP